jgi:hypothetical protein
MDINKAHKKLVHATTTKQADCYLANQIQALLTLDTSIEVDHLQSYPGHSTHASLQQICFQQATAINAYIGRGMHQSHFITVVTKNGFFIAPIN